MVLASPRRTDAAGTICIAIERLLSATSDLRFADGQAPHDAGLFLRGPARLPVVLTRVHQPLAIS